MPNRLGLADAGQEAESFAIRTVMRQGDMSMHDDQSTDSLPAASLPILDEQLKTQGIDQVAPRRSKRKRATADAVVVSKPAPKKTSTGHGSRVRIKVDDELPHNLGPAVIPEVVIKVEGNTTSSTKKLESDVKIEGKETLVLEKISLNPGATPFPEWKSPTPEQCEEVCRLLSSVHGEYKPPAAIPAPSLELSGCGEVPSILDALMRTLLSGATSGRNSAMAFSNLVKRFGILQKGVGKGSVDWSKVRDASEEEVFKAIGCGGLGAKKSAYIKEILDIVHKENLARRDALAAEGERSQLALIDANLLSLDHLHSLSKEEAMLQFVKYPGIGIKTAACVLLFCLRRPCLAVDTHVFRMSKWLGWVPGGTKTPDATFKHLEARVPDHLKYSLHQLFFKHGQQCPRCQASTSEASPDWGKGCIIDHLVSRTGKRKGVPPKQLLEKE